MSNSLRWHAHRTKKKRLIDSISLINRQFPLFFSIIFARFVPVVLHPIRILTIRFSLSVYGNSTHTYSPMTLFSNKNNSFVREKRKTATIAFLITASLISGDWKSLLIEEEKYFLLFTFECCLMTWNNRCLLRSPLRAVLRYRSSEVTHRWHMMIVRTKKIDTIYIWAIDH